MDLVKFKKKKQFIMSFNCKCYFIESTLGFPVAIDVTGILHDVEFLETGHFRYCLAVPVLSLRGMMS